MPVERHQDAVTLCAHAAKRHKVCRHTRQRSGLTENPFPSHRRSWHAGRTWPTVPAARSPSWSSTTRCRRPPRPVCCLRRVLSFHVRGGPPLAAGQRVCRHVGGTSVAAICGGQTCKQPLDPVCGPACPSCVVSRVERHVRQTKGSNLFLGSKGLYLLSVFLAWARRRTSRTRRRLRQQTPLPRRPSLSLPELAAKAQGARISFAITSGEADERNSSLGAHRCRRLNRPRQHRLPRQHAVTAGGWLISSRALPAAVAIAASSWQLKP